MYTEILYDVDPHCFHSAGFHLEGEVSSPIVYATLCVTALATSRDHHPQWLHTCFTENQSGNDWLKSLRMTRS